MLIFSIISSMYHYIMYVYQCIMSILLVQDELEASVRQDPGWGGVEVGRLVLGDQRAQLHRVRVCCLRRAQ